MGGALATKSCTKYADQSFLARGKLTGTDVTQCRIAYVHHVPSKSQQTRAPRRLSRCSGILACYRFSQKLAQIVLIVWVGGA